MTRDQENIHQDWFDQVKNHQMTCFTTPIQLPTLERMKRQQDDNESMLTIPLKR